MCHLCIATPVLFSKHIRRRQCPLFVAVLLSAWKPLQRVCLLKTLSWKPIAYVCGNFRVEHSWIWIPLKALNFYCIHTAYMQALSTKASLLRMTTCTRKSNQCVPSICIESLVAQWKIWIGWHELSFARARHQSETLYCMIGHISNNIHDIHGYDKSRLITLYTAAVLTVFTQYLRRWGECDDTLVCLFF